MVSGVCGDVAALMDADALCYEELQEDTEGNIISRKQLYPIVVYEGFIEQMQLGQFNAQLYDSDPTDGIGKMKDYPCFQQWSNATLVQMDISGTHCAMLEDTAVERALAIPEWNLETRNVI